MWSTVLSERIPTQPLPPPRLERDRVTVALYASFTAWGWFLYSFSPAVPLIAAEQGISRAQAGLHGTALAAGTLLSGFLTAYLNPRFGRRRVLLVGGSVLIAGLVGLMAGHTLAITLPATLVIGLGGTLIISAAQPALAMHHHEASSAAVTEANGVGALVGLVAPLALGASVDLGLGWRPAVGITIGFALAMLALVTRLPRVAALDRSRAPGGGTVAARAGAGPGAATGFSPAFWFFLVSVLMAVAIENTTTYWATDLLRSETGMSAGLASAALTGLIGGMCAVRFAIGPISLRVTPEVLLIASFAVAGIGWLIFWLASVPALAMGGLVIAGLGYGVQYPLGMVLVLRASRGRPDAAQARASLAAGAAIGLAPFVLGALADAVGTHSAFLLVPVLITAGGASVAFGRRSGIRAGSAPA